MKGQYEQQCNAVALKLLGLPVLKNLKLKQYKKIKEWMEGEATVSLDFPDETEWVLNEIIAQEADHKNEAKVPGKTISTPSRFREYVVKKIFYQTGG